MFQLDDKFLEEVGLGGLPSDQKEGFLDHFREQLELRVGTKLTDGLSDAQLDEFSSFMDRNEEDVNAWLSNNVPDYVQDTVFQQLQAGAPAGTPQIVVLSEYASMKWLGINRPDYRDIVASTLGELKKEISENSAAILGASEG